MTPLGWLFLTGSWAALTACTIWCFVKIWQAPFRPEEGHPPVAVNSPPSASGTAE
jgi:hypothetical protein